MTELTIEIKLNDDIDGLGESIIEDLILDILLKNKYDVIEVKSK